LPRHKHIFILLLMAVLALPGFAQGQSEFSPESVLSGLPVQSGGRMKPLDTLARESVRHVTGKAEFQNQDPVLTLLGWWAKPEETPKLELIEFRDLQAKNELGLAAERRWYSLAELQANSKLSAAREEIHKQLRAEEELQGTQLKIQELLGKMNTVQSTIDGSLITAVPNPAGMEQPWGSFADLTHADTVPMVAEAKSAVADLRTAMASNDTSKFQQAAITTRQQLARIGAVPEEVDMVREIRYNKSHPFRKAWMLYLAGLAVLAFVKAEGRSTGYWAGFSLIASGFLMHIYGFYMRCSIAGRPPVTNMYESVIWVAFGAVLFAFILEMVSPKRWYLMSAAAGAIVCLILADILPTVLDPSIRPLTPVLRSNFWLTIHVLSITLGYAGFLLALGLGHIVLWKSATRPEESDKISSLHDALYRALQVGVLLLAAGTILGGVWANYSWGRFWGWDPKEVWALIALLGYLAILHGRHAGWLRKFGIAAWSIIAFQGVLMAWYGVNFVLGAGLHSYGFGTGGRSYVGIYVLCEIAFVLWATWKHRGHQLPAGARG
jgi:cytochrome c-type biogenesis protein CcsB